jgi:hypothetical protein
MSRSTARLIIAVMLAAYGIYTAMFVPGMVAGPSAPALLVFFVLQTLCSLSAAVRVWRGRPWAATTVVALGVAVAATSVFEGFFLGIVPYLRVLLVVVMALLTTLGVAAYVNHGRFVARS